MEDSRNKQLIHFKLHAVLGNAMAPRTVLVCPDRDATPPLSRFVTQGPTGQAGGRAQIMVLVFSHPYVTF